MIPRLKATASLVVAYRFVCLFGAQLRASDRVPQNPIVSLTVTAPSTQVLRGNTLQLIVRGVRVPERCRPLR